MEWRPTLAKYEREMKAWRYDRLLVLGVEAQVVRRAGRLLQRAQSITLAISVQINRKKIMGDPPYDLY